MADVLIVDDNASFRWILKAVMQRQFPSLQIATAADAVEALAEVEHRRPKLIFMDVRLPGKNGFQLTKEIKAAHKEIRVIIMTSYDLPEYRKRARQVGADLFISKKSSTPGEIAAAADSIISKTGQPSDA
jgi:DNA-binding NarL/FixJ family response regulator